MTAKQLDECGCAYIDLADCTYCQEPQRACLHLDGSSGEYGPGVICLACIARLDLIDGPE